MPTDVTDRDACRRLVEAAVERFGGIDVLVNNAGGTMWTRLDEIEDVSIFERLMRLNYLGSVYPTYYALPHLKRARGRLVAVASMAGLIGVPTRTGYSAAKHAVIGFFDSLRVEVADAGVSVTLVCPDFVVVGDPQARARRQRPAASRESDGELEDHDSRGLRRADDRRHRAARTDAAHLGPWQARALDETDRAGTHRPLAADGDPRETLIRVRETRRS